MSTIYNLEAVNLFVGDQADAESNHLRILTLKLPAMEEAFVDWNPGGAMMGTEVETGYNKLEATFNLAGWAPSVMTMIGASQRQDQAFTAYGVLRDRKDGKALEAKAVMQGRMSKAAPSDFQRGQLHQHEYAIKGIVHYELYIDSQEIYFWDIFTNAMRVGGSDINFDTNRILRIPVGG